METDVNITLTTYGSYDEEHDVQYELNFSVPKDWFCRYVHDCINMTINEYLCKYTWDDTIDVYAAAIKDKVIKEEWEV